VRAVDSGRKHDHRLVRVGSSAAVNAVGAGWSAQIVGDATNYGSWPSSDLYWPPAFPTFADAARMVRLTEAVLDSAANRSWKEVS